jgi:hypothetical protein
MNAIPAQSNTPLLTTDEPSSSINKTNSVCYIRKTRAHQTVFSEVDKTGTIALNTLRDKTIPQYIAAQLARSSTPMPQLRRKK